MADCFQVTTTLPSEASAEWYCNLRTTKARLPALTKRLRNLHPYELPEIVAFTIEEADAAYLQWIEAEVESR